MQFAKKKEFNVRSLRVADVSDAIELSISASEALVIHELAKSDLTAEVFQTASILEAALQLKQARLEDQEDAFCYPNEEIDETDFVLDLDDLTMDGAYEDIGLSPVGFEKCLSSSNALIIEKTPLSENCHVCDDDIVKHVEFLAHQKKLAVDPASDLNKSHLAGQINPKLHQSTQENSLVLAVTEPEDGMNSFHTWSSNNAVVEDEISSLVTNRFRSRWFGGWMGKEVDDLMQLEQNNSKSIPKFYVNETSFLSESADVALDENSFVQKHETESKIASQSSIHFEDFNTKADEGILISQDVSCSILSSIDPLCSVVPCSLSTANTDPPLAQNQNGIEADAEKHFLREENLQRSSDLNLESVNRDRQGVAVLTINGPENSVQRQLTLLKTYSALSPRHDPDLEKRCYHSRVFSSECNAEHVTLEENMGHIRSRGRNYPEGFLTLRSTSQFSADRDEMKTYNVTVIRNPCGKTTNRTENNDKLARDAAGLHCQPLKESRFPLVLNRRRYGLHNSKLIIPTSIGKRIHHEAAVTETMVEHHKRNNLPLDTHVPIAKRVHLSEVEVDQKARDVEKLQSSYKIHSTTRACEMSKHSDASLNSPSQDVKRCFANHRKYEKRLIFKGIQFLLTGFSRQKEKEVEGLIQKNGGLVLLDIPSPKSQGMSGSKCHFQQLPILICPKKLKTTKFLYGCAVNAFILKVRWLTDSIASGSVAPPEKYMIFSNQADLKRTEIREAVSCDRDRCIFGRVGIMLHGKQSFCTKFAVIFKHGGGQVFKTLQRLVQSLDTQKTFVGAIVAEDEERVSRHLRQCGLERKIPILPAGWIINSLYIGNRLPYTPIKHIP